MFGLDKYGNGIGLHRARRFFEFAHIPPNHFAERSLVITGSNGKGSTARMCYAMLQPHVDQVGCFISPHLVNLTERFEINGQQITQAEFEEYKERVLTFNRDHLPASEFIGAFELLFYIALLWFYDRDVDYIVWEAGIGGRYDPTRMLQAPISALTSIDLEHTELLGNTKELIAYDKLDVTRAGGASVISLSIDSGLLERIRAFGAVAGKQFHILADRYSIQSIDQHTIHQQIMIQSTDPQQDNFVLQIPLLGQHQAENVITAFETTRLFLARHQQALSVEAANQALQGIQWAGRMEQIATDPTIWIDVGHTPNALDRVITEFLSLYKPSEVVVVYGVSHNKNIEAITQRIEQNFETVILTQAYKNGMPVEALAATFVQSEKIIAQYPTIEQAVQSARDYAIQNDKVVIVLGGLFVAIEFKTALHGGDPQALNFF